MKKKTKITIAVVSAVAVLFSVLIIIKITTDRNDKGEESIVSADTYDTIATYDKAERIFDIATSEDADASALISGYVDDEGDVIITTDSNDIIDSFTEDDKEYIVIKDENGDKTQIEVKTKENGEKAIVFADNEETGEKTTLIDVTDIAKTDKETGKVTVDKEDVKAVKEEIKKEQENASESSSDNGDDTQPTSRPVYTKDTTPEPAKVTEIPVTKKPEATKTPEATQTAEVTDTPTPVKTVTPTDKPVATEKPVATNTPTSVPVATVTPVNTPTGTAKPTVTSTSTPKPTNTPVPTNTAKPTATTKPTVTTKPTNTPTPTTHVHTFKLIAEYAEGKYYMCTSCPYSYIEPWPSAVVTATPTNTPTPTTAPHTHSWVAQYTTVHHPAETHLEDKYETYEDPVYVATDVCKVCKKTAIDLGYDKYKIVDGKAVLISADIEGFDYHCRHCGPDSEYWKRGYYADTQLIGYVTKTDWVGYTEVVDKPAWDEQVISGYKCSICGATK